MGRAEQARDRIFGACDALYAEMGTTPTLDAIVSKVGGSNTTANKYRAEWLARERAGRGALLHAVRMNPAIATRYLDLVALIRDEVDETAGAESVDLRRQILALEEEAGRLKADRSGLESELREAKIAVESAIALLSAERDLVSQLQGQVADLRARLDAQSQQVAEMARQHADSTEAFRKEAAERYRKLEDDMRDERRFFAEETDRQRSEAKTRTEVAERKQRTLESELELAREKIASIIRRYEDAGRLASRQIGELEATNAAQNRDLTMLSRKCAIAEGQVGALERQLGIWKVRARRAEKAPTGGGIATSVVV